MNTFEMDQAYIAGTYKRFPVEIVSGKGSLVKDVDGKEYIDIWNTDHEHPWSAAVPAIRQIPVMKPHRIPFLFPNPDADMPGR